ncbi:MAG TPA: mechanosensitive ion channel family protein [Kofleriaceae bacterium]|nr:mechanosensitive ion channel family protein [Kofleriaceae bacterium]
MNHVWDSLRDLAHQPLAAVLAIVIGATAAGLVITRMLSAIWTRIARRTQATWDDEVASRLGAPVSALLAVQFFNVALTWVDLEPHQVAMLDSLVATVTVACVIWASFRFIDLARDALARRSWAIHNPASRSLLALAARFAKAAALAMGSLVALSQLGVSVASLIAGLGIGGLVLALAAQKTVENVFGAVSIGIDQPLREGDFVRVYDFVGTVEQIGLRSTRIRTLDRTIITVPNGDLANQRIESYSVRDRIRLACTVGLEYRTTTAQMRSVLAALEAILRRHPKIWPDSVVVRFAKLGESSLDIDIMAWFQTGDWNEFQAIRQAVLLDFMEAVEAAGTSIAFPTRTLMIQPAGVSASSLEALRPASSRPGQTS